VSTRGIYALRELGIDHEPLVYRYDKMGAEIAADAVGEPHGVVLKSLVFRTDDGSFLFALIASDAVVSTRKLGRASGHKHVETADPRDAQRVTGYLVGGISPLGARQRLPVFLDRETARQPSLVINAGARGTLVKLATDDLVRATDARLADFRT
jgi:Cys-tRNA(Pro)/Cys-tRNA(Cys) deacylase